MTTRPHSLKGSAFLGFVVMTCAGLASCGGGGSSGPVSGGSGDQMLSVPPSPNVPPSSNVPESQGQPDLVVGSPSVSDGGPAAGASFTLSTTVRNDGDGTSPATTLRYYRSTDAMITTSDTAVGMDAVAELAASGSGSESVQLTAPASPGTYYYGACVDAVAEESDTTNNCSASVQVIVLVTQPPPGQPDLVVGSPSVSDSGPAAGASFTLSATVRNDGDGASGATTLRYYRSADATITTSDTAVGTGAVVGLAASGSGSESVDLTAPASPGTYYYGACVDAVAGESDTTNNCSTSVQVTVPEPPGQPDLVVGSPSVSDGGPAAGASFTLSATVRNDGDGASGATTLRYYRSTDATITTSDRAVGTGAVVGLAASGSGSESVDLTAPASPGTYYYGACVDAVAGESDTTNNCSTSVQVTVPEPPGQPDLVVGSPSVSDSGPAAGASFTLSTTVRNDGDGTSPATTLRYYRSTDATITTSDRAVGTGAVVGLAASGSGSESVDLTAPSSPGTYYYGACVDAVAGESDTTNNCSTSVQVTVPEPPGQPDLVVGSPSVSDSGPAAGASFTLSTTVRNDGDGTSPATTLRYYRSTDATITTSDRAVGTGAVVGLAASGSGSESVDLTAPSSPGTYYYGACVDAVAGESDTTNNCSSSVSVTVDDEAASAPSALSISIELSPGHQVPPNTAITATITLSNLDVVGYSSVMFRADLTVFGHGQTGCNGDDTGKDIEIPVDDSKETFTVRVFDTCPHGNYGNYTLVARVFTVDDRIELVSAATNFLMSSFLAPGEVIPDPPAPGVRAWLDPAPPSVMYAGEWYPLRVRADVRLYLNDHVGVFEYSSDPNLLTSRSASTPTETVEEACADTSLLLGLNWRRAIHQSLHVAACRPGIAVISVRHETDAIDPLSTYEVQILPARTANQTRTRGVSASTPTLSVADARAHEGVDATIDFVVTLERAAAVRVTVDYATADGTATAGADYTAASGTLTFAPGETEQTVVVTILDDAHDEGEEAFTLTLSNPSGARIEDGKATGTIENTDPLQRAWLARFGRTAATHVTDAVGERLRGASAQGSHVTVGGYRLPLGKKTAGAAEPWADPRLGRLQTLRLRDLLLGSSFRLALGSDDEHPGALRLTAWGRVAGTRFNGRDDGSLSLDGDVLTGTLGVDGAWARWLAGVAVSHSRGGGSFSMTDGIERDSGELDNTLTSIHPYLRYAVNDRLDVWGLLGYGWGDLTLEQGNGVTLETDTALVMGAFGGRGILLPASETGGFELATRTDAMLTRTTSEAVAGMASAEADAHRLRLILEGSRGFTWAEGRSLTPSVELGLRHDWGDAETGFGLELGGRVRYTDPAKGLTLEGAIRGLLAHEDSDYEEWGAWGTVRIAPGADGQGLALTLSPTWGAASSGVDGLWSRQTTAGLASQGTRQTPTGRLNAEIGYGLAAPFGAGLLTPYAGTVLSDGADRTYRLGGRLRLTGRWTTGLTLNLEGTRQEPAGQQPPNQGLRLQATWGF